MESFLETGQLYRFKDDLLDGSASYWHSKIGFLYSVEYITKGEHFDRILPIRPPVFGESFTTIGWSLSLLVGEKKLHLFFRSEEYLLSKLEKIGSNQGKEMV